jgi:predicted nucleic acid-binding protein
VISPQHKFAADTSFLINVVATGFAGELLSLAGIFSVIPPLVYEEAKRDRATIDDLIAGGLAIVVQLDKSAREQYVTAAAAMDDGEAAAIALGISMQIGLATDDNCALDYWNKLPQVVVPPLGICSFLRSIEAKIDPSRMRSILTDVRKKAKFLPQREHKIWWQGIVGN